MMAGVEDLVACNIKAESGSELETTFKHIRELTRTGFNADQGPKRRKPEGHAITVEYLFEPSFRN